MKKKRSERREHRKGTETNGWSSNEKSRSSRGNTDTYQGNYVIVSPHFHVSYLCLENPTNTANFKDKNAFCPDKPFRPCLFGTNMSAFPNQFGILHVCPQKLCRDNCDRCTSHFSFGTCPRFRKQDLHIPVPFRITDRNIISPLP